MFLWAVFLVHLFHKELRHKEENKFLLLIVIYKHEPYSDLFKVFFIVYIIVNSYLSYVDIVI